jgi:pyruvate kinase
MNYSPKIGATLGPASASSSLIEKMIIAGVTFTRLNFSHGTHHEHAALIKNVRQSEKKTKKHVEILQDLQGPKIRLGILPKEGVELVMGKQYIFNTLLKEYDGKEIPLVFPGLEKFLQSGHHFLIDDGRVEVKVTKIQGPRIIAKVIDGGVVISHKGLNFPHTDFYNLPAITHKDKNDLKFGLEQKVDMVALSFVKTAADIVELKELIKNYNKELKFTSEPLIIAKIERKEALDNLTKILKVVDGVMVARGDLGLEMPPEQLAILQKNIVAAANKAKKPVIVATQMLDAMIENKRPTRAELTDVANAVIDGADGLLLTNETAVGRYPILVVETMKKIIEATKKSSYFLSKRRLIKK